jgi:hypothetical protein
MSPSTHFDLQPHNTPVMLQSQPATTLDDDPLIARHWQQTAVIGGCVLAIALIITIGALNRQLEYALLFAAFLSGLLLIPLMFL